MERNKGKMKRCCESVMLVLDMVVGTVFGCQRLVSASMNFSGGLFWAVGGRM
jgi:hypothetical protein